MQVQLLERSIFPTLLCPGLCATLQITKQEELNTMPLVYLSHCSAASESSVICGFDLSSLILRLDGTREALSMQRSIAWLAQGESPPVAH